MTKADIRRQINTLNNQIGAHMKMYGDGKNKDLNDALDKTIAAKLDKIKGLEMKLLYSKLK